MTTAASATRSRHPGPSRFFATAHVAVVTPTLFEVSVGYCYSLLHLTRRFEALGIRYGVRIQPGCTLLGEARSAFVASFLESHGTHLLMVDSDVEFSPDTVVALLEADVDVIGAAVPSKQLRVQEAIGGARAGHPAPERLLQSFGSSVSEHNATDKDGIVEVDWLAPGLVLLKRAMLEQMVKGYPDLMCRTSLYPKGPICFLFQQVVRDGVVEGEDISFFRRWRAIGGRCHVLTDATIGHLGRHTFVGNFSEMLEAAEAAAANRSEGRVGVEAPAERHGRPVVGSSPPCPCGSGRTLAECHAGG